MSPRPRKAWQVWSNVKVMLTVSLFWRCYSPWIFTSWPDCQQRVLSWSDQTSVRGREKKKANFVKGEKMDAPTQRFHTFHTAYSWLSCKVWDHNRPATTVIARSHISRLPFCFWSCNPHWKVDVLSLLRISKKIHWQAVCNSTKSIPAMLQKLRAVY
jgi:hypothetical protein